MSHVNSKKKVPSYTFIFLSQVTCCNRSGIDMLHFDSKKLSMLCHLFNIHVTSTRHHMLILLNGCDIASNLGVTSHIKKRPMLWDLGPEGISQTQRLNIVRGSLAPFWTPPAPTHPFPTTSKSWSVLPTDAQIARLVRRELHRVDHQGK